MSYALFPPKNCFGMLPAAVAVAMLMTSPGLQAQGSDSGLRFRPAAPRIENPSEFLDSSRSAPPAARAERFTEAQPPRTQAPQPRAAAQRSAPRQETPAVKSGVAVSKSLSEMGFSTEPLTLRSWQSSINLPLPWSPREDLQAVRMVLDTVNSTALIRSRSALTVRVNGHVLRQSQLDPTAPKQRAVLDIPVNLLKPGYNDVQVSVVQHYTYDCEDPNSPELWTEINTNTSGFEMVFTGHRPNPEPRLSQLNIAFDTRAWLPRPLAVVSGAEQVNAPTFSAAAYAIQGIALRQPQILPEVRWFTPGAALAPFPGDGFLPGLLPNITAGRDVLLVGKRSEVSRYLSADVYRLTGAGAFAGVFPVDGNKGVAVVITGTTDEEVEQAARAFAIPDFKFSDVTMELISGNVALPPFPVATPRNAIQLHEFGFRTTTSRGFDARPIRLEFRAPGDYGANIGEFASLKLHLSYGAGLRPDSSVVVKLNNNVVSSIPLNQPSGAEHPRFEVSLPAQFIRPGFNELQFEPVLNGMAGRCDSIRPEGMTFTLFEDSTLTLPRATRLPVVPDLGRFASGLWPHNQQWNFYLTDARPDTAAAALSVAAMMTQRSRSPLPVSWVDNPAEYRGHVLAVGNHDKHLELFGSGGQARPWTPDGVQAMVTQGLQGSHALTGFYAASPATLSRAVHQLYSEGLWGSLDGESSLIDTDQQSVRVSRAQQAKEIGTLSQLALLIPSGNWVIGAAGALALLFAVAFSSMLRRKSKHRQETEEFS